MRKSRVFRLKGVSPMKKKRNLPLLIINLLLLAALSVSLFFLYDTKSDLAVLQAQIQELTDENAQLSNLNYALQLQLDNQFLQDSGASTYVEEDYCALMIAQWSAQDGILSFDAQAEVFLTTPAEITARLELWRGDAVYDSQPVTLTKADSDTAWQTALSASFQIPPIAEGEELQLWLMVETDDGNTLFACAAGWYLENGQLAMITG